MKKFALIAILVIAIGMVMVYCLTEKDYKVLAGELSIGTGFAISPSKVVVEPLKPHKLVVIPMVILNTGAEEKTFSLNYRYPDRVEKGYIPYEINQNLNIVTDYTDFADITLKPGEVAKLNIIVELMIDSKLPNTEAWLSVKPKINPSIINTELCMRLLIKGN